MFGLGLTELLIIVVVTLLITVVPVVAICWLVVVLVRSSERPHPPHMSRQDAGDRSGR